MLNLNLTIDNHSGFCFGVVYAIEMAEEILDTQGYLFCLGDIVHNDEEVKRLKKLGLITIDHNQLASIKNEYVLIRAHGEPPSTYQIAIENNITLIDATCPVVLKLQNRIKKSFDNKENIFLFGKQGHAEVEGLMGQIQNKGVVFADVAELDSAVVPDEITVYTQTTKSKQRFHEITNILRERGIKVNAHDTICTQVADRDNELRKFAKKFDKIVFVAGTKSSNGKVLYNVCKEVNAQSYFVSTLEEVNLNWFDKENSVGICGATSTPMWLMEDIKNYLAQA
ncbi:MAG TPA: 4-hydroxy-3-methylbut-2-enyl diphosphate reductase [Bacteroidia bacterium]|nr:4-hydroxy-3-methylbut-2-enyl diphosphate reductase [Bacteroidia bacterium]